MVNEAAEVKQIMPLDISFNMSSSYGVALHMQADRRSLQQLLETELHSYKSITYLSRPSIYWRENKCIVVPKLNKLFLNTLISEMRQ